MSDSSIQGVRDRIGSDSMKAEIDLKENAIYITKNGKITKIPALNFGEHRIIWKNGEVLDIIKSERVRV